MAAVKINFERCRASTIAQSSANIIMSSTKDRPVFSIISLITSLVGILMAIPVVISCGPIFGAIFAFFICFGVAVLGLFFAFISLCLRERFLYLSIIAFLLNGILLLWLWSIRNERLMGP